MTLIVVGHNFEKEITYSWVFNAPTESQQPRLKPTGIFVVADSSITACDSNSLQTVLLSGFRKIYPVTIKIWKPYFIGLYFHSYQEVHYESECFVAIAGSTLTAQHVLNLISEHLGKIRISYERSNTFGMPGKYVLIRHCQRNELENGQGVDTWDEDMFTPNDYIDLITANDVAAIIEYSINEALSSARKYKIDKRALDAMYCEFAVGIHCPKEKSHKLYVFRMNSRTNTEGLIEVYTEREEIMEGDVAVLGMRNEFESEAKALMQSTIATNEKAALKFFDFVNEAIDKFKGQGSFAIDRPSVCKVFSQGQLKTIRHTGNAHNNSFQRTANGGR